MTTYSSPITSSIIENDSIVLITSSQLKETNLIFAEHSKLLHENKLLSAQLEHYKANNSLLVLSDSIRRIQIANYNNLSNEYIKHINSLNNDIRKKDNVLRTWKIGGITISASLFLLFLFK